jgi:hypothetical protein
MKLTKSKLKQVIKEELAYVLNEAEGEYDYPDEEAAADRHDAELEKANPQWGKTKVREQWEIDMEKIMEAAVRLYEKMPLEGKEALTANFEKYAEHYAYKTREFAGDRGPSWMREDDSDADDEEELKKDIRYRSGGEWPPVKPLPGGRGMK